MRRRHWWAICDALLVQQPPDVRDRIDALQERDVDTVVEHAPGLRWFFMDPLGTVDLNAPGGIADSRARYGNSYEDLHPRMPPRAWDEAVVGASASARRTALRLSAIEAGQDWRDRRLAAHRAGRPRG